MRNFFLASIMLLLASIAYADECEPCKKIIVSGNFEYPPLTWQDKKNPDKIIGFAIELLEIACKDIGIEVEGKFVGPWARTQNEVKNGNVDMIGGMYITEERKKYMDYIIPPIIMDPTVVFVKKGDKFKFEIWEDLIGLSGGAPIGNSYGEEFDRFAKEKLSIERVSTLVQAFKKLESGRNRYLVYGLYPGLAGAEITGFRDKIDYLPNSVISEGLYFTISKKSPCNCQKIKEHLTKKVKEFSSQKLPEQLMEKYLKIWKEQ
ncbi:MAG: transporter substrate-binding domain-containing protein [Desulfamplus sp.]|nr:transporter substrate-binding domain-containing protein [Desulfamplus sp.]